MTQSATDTKATIELLKEAIALARDGEPQAQAQAQEKFEALSGKLVGADAETLDLLALLWQSFLSSQRSIAFWQEMSQVEKNLSDRITENHIQLKQNYMRLLQEQ